MNIKARLRSAHRVPQMGQSMTEFLVIAPLLLFFCFGTIQFVLLYQAKSTLDVAVLEAAREGAVNHGSMTAMQAGLARGLAPLYARQATVEGVQAAQSKAAVELVTGSQISIVSPTPAMVSDFARPRYYPEEGAYEIEIPNDTLMYRGTALGPASGVDIQDANLLKIRVHYCYNMYVPLVNKVIYYVTNVIGTIGTGGILTREPGDYIEYPYGEPQQPDFLCKIKLADGMATDRWPLPLESEVIVRMQSPFRSQASRIAQNAANARAP